MVSFAFLLTLIIPRGTKSLRLYAVKFSGDPEGLESGRHQAGLYSILQRFCDRELAIPTFAPVRARHHCLLHEGPQSLQVVP
jgi:hypothetical protein